MDFKNSLKIILQSFLTNLMRAIMPVILILIRINMKKIKIRQMMINFIKKLIISIAIPYRITQTNLNFEIVMMKGNNNQNNIEKDCIILGIKNILKKRTAKLIVVNKVSPVL